ncbi:hypothetical protein, partial [Vibrio aestuarianus]
PWDRGADTERMLFNHSTKKSFDGYVLPTCFRNQIKCFAVWEMLSDSVPYGYANIVSTVSKLTDIAKTAIEIGLEGFHQLDIDSIFEMINEQCFIVNDKGNKTLSAINRLVQASSHISIAIPIHEKLKPETFNKVVTGSEQYPVIPHRPFLEMISTSSDEMQNAFKNIEALSEAIERYLQKTEDIKAEIIEKVRTGVVDLDDVIASDRNSMVTAIKKSFFEAGIAIADDYKADNQDWFKVWEEHKVTYQTSFASAETIEFTATIGNKRIRNRSEFNDYLRELQGYCCFLC